MLLCLGSNPSSLSANAEIAGDDSNGAVQEERGAGNGIPPAGRAGYLDILLIVEWLLLDIRGCLEIEPSKNKCLHEEG